MSYCPQNPTLWPGQSLSSPVSCSRTHIDSQKSCSEVLKFVQSRWLDLCNLSARGVPKIFGKFSETLQFFRASWAQHLCDPDAGRWLFSDMNAMLTRPTLSDVVRYAQLTIDGCKHFFVRGACRISRNFAIFFKIFTQNLRDLDARLARYLALERPSTRKKELQRRFAVRTPTLAEFMQPFCARRAENFRKHCNFFARVQWAQNLCDPDAGRWFFSNMHAMLTRSTLSDVVRYAQLTIDGCTQFFVRGACRISGNFAIFCKNFTQNLRDLDAGLARYLALERTSTRKRAAAKFCSSYTHAG